jgi:hypothetical protein
MSFMRSSDIYSSPGDVHFFKVPFPLNWLNQSQIALLPCVWKKLRCIVAVDLLLVALCFLLHTGHPTNCGYSFAYVHYACAWCMLKGCVCVCVCVCVRACVCGGGARAYVCMCKKTLCIDEHITSNPTSIFLFS